jgi:hypothetical protein
VSEDPTHQPLFIPVCDNGCGFTLRLFRDRDGSRCAVAFTVPERLTAVLGSGQRWVELAESALRDMVCPLGVERLVVDPALIAPPVTPHPQHSAQPPRPVAPAAAGPVAGPAAAPVARPAAVLAGATGTRAAARVRP